VFSRVFFAKYCLFRHRWGYGKGVCVVYKEVLR
jgi:hypothetical protein